MAVTKSRRTRGWRRVASAIWKAPSDPQIYGWVDLDASAVLGFIDEHRAHGEHLTVSHVVGRAIAHALHETHGLNIRLIRGREYPKPTIDIFFITDVARGRDLTGVKVFAADTKSAVEIAQEVNRGARSLKAGEDPDFNRSKRLMESLPFFLLRPLIRLIAFLVGDLRLRVRPLGLHPSPFGSAMLSNVGSIGLPNGLSPISWLYRVPVLVLAGEVTKRPWVVDDHLEIRPVLPISASIDHRYVDGAHLASFFRSFRAYIANPWRFEPHAEPRETLTSLEAEVARQ